VPQREQLLESIHANHAAVIDTCAEALAPMVAALVVALDQQAKLIETGAGLLQVELSIAIKEGNANAVAELVETQLIVADLVDAAKRLVATVHAARKVVQRGGD
jgi:hypothetical protein